MSPDRYTHRRFSYNIRTWGVRHHNGFCESDNCRKQSPRVSGNHSLMRMRGAKSSVFALHWSACASYRQGLLGHHLTVAQLRAP